MECAPPSEVSDDSASNCSRNGRRSNCFALLTLVDSRDNRTLARDDWEMDEAAFSRSATTWRARSAGKPWADHKAAITRRIAG